MATDKSKADQMVETVQKIYSAVNEFDLEKFLSFFDSQIERFETFGGHYKGLEELKANFTKGRGTWAEGGCNPEDFIVQKEKVIVSVHVKVRLKNQNEWIDDRLTDVFSFRGQKAVQFFSFADRTEALKWAGIKDI